MAFDDTSKMFWGFLVFILIFVGLFFLLAEPSVTDFDSCLESGYPVMESHPRQCNGPGDQVFVEEIDEDLVQVPENEAELIEIPSTPEKERVPIAEDLANDETINPDTSGLVCSQDVKQCSDGSFVSRKQELNCGFAPCPVPADTGNAPVCENYCGDGVCQEVTCQGELCPCIESVSSCPADCS